MADGLPVRVWVYFDGTLLNKRGFSIMQIAEPEIAQYVAEAEGLLLSGRFSDLVSLLLTSADLVLAHAPEKGKLGLQLFRPPADHCERRGRGSTGKWQEYGNM